MKEESLNAGIQFLANHGLNLFAALDVAALPTDICEPLQNAGIPLHTFPRLVLLGHGGRQLWQAMAKHKLSTVDPVDNYSLQITTQFNNRYLDNAEWHLLFPTDLPISLTKLGELAGWSHPSPIGTGINPIYGLWWAYRAAFLTMVQLPVTEKDTRPSPCLSCVEKPCMPACPPQAASQNGCNWQSCAEFRMKPQSPCRDRCLARNACPVAPQHRYSTEQMAYHYLHSLASIKKFLRFDN